MKRLIPYIYRKPLQLNKKTIYYKYQEKYNSQNRNEISVIIGKDAQFHYKSYIWKLKPTIIYISPITFVQTNYYIQF